MGIANKKVKEYFIDNNIIFIEYIDGDFYTDDIFNNIDYIVKSSGIKFDTPFLIDACKKDIKIISDLELYYLYNKEKELIVVTGTNGKTTTTTLISNLLNDGNIINSGVYGNIGTPLFSKKDDNIVIIEASSFMLHNSYEIKPHIYVITSLVSHHLDYHKKEEDYFYDKTKIINNLKETDYLIFNSDYHIINKMVNNNRCKIIKYSFFDENADVYIKENNIFYKNKKIFDIQNFRRKELHNLENMLAAFIVGTIYNIDCDIIKESFIKFNGLEHRFEIIIETSDLVIINDSKSTSPASLEKAIDNICINKYEKYSKILILGGNIVDKDYNNVNLKLNLFDYIFVFGKSQFEYCKLLKYNKIYLFDTLDEVILYIKNKINKKLLILFSPSSPSYDLYSNYEKRGNHFKELIFYHNFCN